MLGPMDGVGFRIGFIRAMIAMTPSMDPEDLKTFEQICRNAIAGKLSGQDLGELDKLYHKFDKPD